MLYPANDNFLALRPPGRTAPHQRTRLSLIGEGQDRLGLIAEVGARLKRCHVSVNSISYRLELPDDQWYRLEAEVEGAAGNIAYLEETIARGNFLSEFPLIEYGGEPVNWRAAYLLSLSLDTPDQPDLTADVAQSIYEACEPMEVGNHPNGNILQLVGRVGETEGAEGEDSRYSLYATVATRSAEVQKEIIERLTAYARWKGIEDDMRLCRLNLMADIDRLIAAR